MSFKQVSFRNWKLADLVSRKLACGQHSSNHPVLEFSNCLSYLLHSRGSDARFLKALSCPPDWHPLYSSTLAGQASAAFWHRDERSSMVTFFTKCSHYTSLVSNKVTIVLNSASESNHWTVLGSALNHNVGITAVGVHEVEHVGGLATMATINFKKVLGAGSPKRCKKDVPHSPHTPFSLTDEKFLTWLLIAYSRLLHKPPHVVGSKNLRAEHFLDLVPGTWFQPSKPHHDYLPGQCQCQKKSSIERHLITNWTSKQSKNSLQPLALMSQTFPLLEEQTKSLHTGNLIFNKSQTTSDSRTAVELVQL